MLLEAIVQENSKSDITMYVEANVHDLIAVDGDGK